MWRASEHPDPEEETTQGVIAYLQQRWEEFTERDVGIFIDFGVGFPGMKRGEAGSEEEEKGWAAARCGGRGALARHLKRAHQDGDGAARGLRQFQMAQQEEQPQPQPPLPEQQQQPLPTKAESSIGDALAASSAAVPVADRAAEAEAMGSSWAAAAPDLNSARSNTSATRAWARIARCPTRRSAARGSARVVYGVW